MTKPGAGNIPTADFLMKLKETENFEDFYSQNIETFLYPTLPQYLAGLCEDKEIPPGKLFMETAIEKSLGYKIFTGKRRLSRDNALKMAFGLGLDVKETQRLLTVSKNSQLYPFIPRDAALLYCLHRGMGYREAQDSLYDWKMTVLGDDHENHG